MRWMGELALPRLHLEGIGLYAGSMNWALATIVPNCEHRVGAELRRRNLPHHIFRIKQRVVARGRVVDRLVPAFPRYVFVPAQECWETVRKVADFTGLVSASCDQVVSDLTARAPNGVLPSTPRLSVGDRVRVAMLGSVGIFQRFVGMDKACVLLPWFNRMVETVVYEKDLEKVARTHRSRRRRH